MKIQKFILPGVMALMSAMVPFHTEAHVFSLSCKVTAVNGDFTTAEGRAKAIAWCRANHITKLWLESYRHGEQVPLERLIEERDAFRQEGFVVAGMITPTQLNDSKSMVCCWTDPKACARLETEAVRAARVFDEIILDDFLFTSCTCERCQAEQLKRGIQQRGDFRVALMMEVCERHILKPGKAVNPKVQFIIKYPCWWQSYHEQGYDPAAEAELFGQCWVGTETRDINPNPLQACWIMDWMDHLTKGRCGGGWYDPLHIADPSKFVEQARYTILGGARESLVHCYDYLLAEDPGKAAFNEAMNGRLACAKAFAAESAGLKQLAETLEGTVRGPYAMEPNKVSRHIFMQSGCRYEAFQNTSGVDAELKASFGGRKVLSLPTDDSATLQEDGIVRLKPHALLLVKGQLN